MSSNLSKKILNSIAQEDFLSHYYGRRLYKETNNTLLTTVRHITDTDPIQYFQSLPLNDFKDFIVFRDGIACKGSVYITNGEMNWDTVTQMYKMERCTLYIRNLEKFDSEVKKLISRVSNFFRKRAFANIFVTPPNAVGLPVHLDLTEFLVVHLEGSKRWKIWKAPCIQSITDSRADNARLAADSSSETPPYADITLQPGWLLYLPKYFIHEPISGGEGAIHLTIGLIDEIS